MGIVRRALRWSVSGWWSVPAAAVVLVLAVAPGSGAPRADELRLAPEPVPVTGPDLVEHVREDGAAATLVNVWATWCVPCRQEFPELLRVAKAYRGKGLSLVLVSADFDSNVDQARVFLAEHGVDFPTFLKRGDDESFIDALDRSWSGALPATFVFDGHGRLVEFWEGKADYARFEQAVQRALKGSAHQSRGRG